jgi:hypothetical protein
MSRDDREFHPHDEFVVSFIQRHDVWLLRSKRAVINVTWQVKAACRSRNAAGAMPARYLREYIHYMRLICLACSTCIPVLPHLANGVGDTSTCDAAGR